MTFWTVKKIPMYNEMTGDLQVIVEYLWEISMVAGTQKFTILEIKEF